MSNSNSLRLSASAVGKEKNKPQRHKDAKVITGTKMRFESFKLH